MDPESVKMLIERLMKTGEILATEGYRLALQQVQAETVSGALWSVIFLGLLLLSIWAAKKLFNLYEENTYGGYDILAVVAGATGVIFAVLFSTTLNETILMAINPEWYAIQKLLELL